MLKNVGKKIIVAGSLILFLVLTNCVMVSATCQSGILGNGTNGIYIDINSGPYLTYAKKAYGQYAYGKEGCAWFASARAFQKTGKDTSILSGYGWYYTGYSIYGYSRGDTIRENSLACFGNHVVFIEKVNGSSITVSEGGVSGYSNAAHGYCVIRNTTVYDLTKVNHGYGAFYGYVYLTAGSSENTRLNVTPVGCFDGCVGGTGEITVYGWAKDEDLPDQAVPIHVYIGGPAGSGAPGYAISADIYRTDVGKHSFHSTIKTDRTGQQTIYVYAINIGGGSGNPLLGTKTVNISADTIAPTISDIKVKKDEQGYTVTCKVTDNCGIDRVQFPTWSLKNGQDDLYNLGEWITAGKVSGTINGSTVTFRVNRSDHFNDSGTYITDIYAYDIHGNLTTARTSCDFYDCSHKYRWTIIKNATCGTNGSRIRQCILCKMTTGSEQIISATGKHKFGKWVITEEATALKTGTKKRICSVCGKEDVAAIARLKPTIKLNVKSTIVLKRGKTKTIKVSGLAKDDYVKSWSTSNKKIVKVSDSGKVTAQKRIGSAKIKITLASGKQVTVKVRVW